MGKIKTKLISLIAAAAMLIATVPAMAASDSVEITDYMSVDEKFSFDWNTSVSNQSKGYLIVQTSKAQQTAENKPYFGYSVYSEEGGAYKLKFTSSPIVSPEWTSPATVTLNGSVIDDIGKTKDYDANKKDYEAVVTLKAGENKIRFTITDKRAQSETESVYGLFHFYNLSLTPAAKKTINENGTLIVEAQNYETTTHTLKLGTNSDMSNCYGSDYYYLPVIAAPATITYNVEAPEDGYYSMTLYASDHAGWLGDFEVKLNGISLGNSKANGAFYSGINSISYSAGATWFIKKHNPITVRLNKGDNVIKIESCDKGSNGNYGFALDCFKFEPQPAPSLIFDEINGNAEYSNESYHGGKGRQLFTDATMTYTLDLPAGTYDLYVCAECTVWTQYLAPLGFKLGDAEEYTDFSTDNVTTVEKKYTNGGEFKYNTQITLDGSTTTLTFKTTAASPLNSNGNYVLFDYFELVPTAATITAPSISAPSNVMSCGTTMQLTSALRYDNGYSCSDRFIESVTYASSDTRVATVDANGLVTANNPGVADISVTYNDTYTATINITVYDESGVVPVSISYNSETGEAVVKLTRTGSGTGNAAVIVGAYSVQDGTSTSLSDVKVFSDLNPAVGRITTIRHTLTGDSVCAYIWDSLNGMKPITEAITLK